MSTSARHSRKPTLPKVSRSRQPSECQPKIATTATVTKRRASLAFKTSKTSKPSTPKHRNVPPRDPQNILEPVTPRASPVASTRKRPRGRPRKNTLSPTPLPPVKRQCLHVINENENEDDDGMLEMVFVNGSDLETQWGEKGLERRASGARVFSPLALPSLPSPPSLSSSSEPEQRQPEALTYTPESPVLEPRKTGINVQLSPEPTHRHVSPEPHSDDGFQFSPEPRRNVLNPSNSQPANDAQYNLDASEDVQYDHEAKKVPVPAPADFMYTNAVHTPRELLYLLGSYNTGGGLDPIDTTKPYFYAPRLPQRTCVSLPPIIPYSIPTLERIIPLGVNVENCEFFDIRKLYTLPPYEQREPEPPIPRSAGVEELDGLIARCNTARRLLTSDLSGAWGSLEGEERRMLSTELKETERELMMRWGVEYSRSG